MTAVDLIQSVLVTASSKDDILIALEGIPVHVDRLITTAGRTNRDLDDHGLKAAHDIQKLARALAKEVRDTPGFRISAGFVKSCDRVIAVLINCLSGVKDVDPVSAGRILGLVKTVRSGVRELADENENRESMLHGRGQLTEATVEPGTNRVESLIAAVHKLTKGRIDVRPGGYTKIVGIPGATRGAEIAFKTGAAPDQRGEFYVSVDGGRGHGSQGFYAKNATDVLRVARRYDLCK